MGSRTGLESRPSSSFARALIVAQPILLSLSLSFRKKKLRFIGMQNVFGAASWREGGDK
jgi:hypothetical protein